MTIRIPKPSFLDKLLKSVGKKRGVVIPVKSIEKYGMYAYNKAYKESIFKAFLRSKNDELPKGLIDIFDIKKCNK
jgi:hypothetical protein